MDLWIRSQDKTNLIKVYDIYIAERSKIRANFQKGYSCAYTELGEYATEERALEVLDEIQSLLQPKLIYQHSKPITTIEDGCFELYQNTNVEIQQMKTYVYVMPKE